MKVRFTVPGRPIPKARPRVVKGRAYTPAASAAYARLVLMLARRAWPKRWPLDARYSVEVVVTPEDGNCGDGDNYLKACTDPLRGLAWSDDRRVKRWVCEILEPAKDVARMDVTIAVLP